jgi:hypothetical protein
MLLRSILAPRNSDAYRSTAHISGEYFVYFCCISAYLYSVVIPLLKQWKWCCYRPRKAGQLSVPIMTATYTHASQSPKNRTSSNGSAFPALTTPHNPLSPTSQRSNRGNNNGATATFTPAITSTTHTITIRSSNTAPSDPTNTRVLQSWDDREMIMLAQSVPPYWHDLVRILRHPTASPLFMATAQRYLCPENVRFWVAVDELESIVDPLEHINDIHTRVLAIYYEHIKAGATFEINIGAPRRVALARLLGLHKGVSSRVTLPTEAAVRALTARHLVVNNNNNNSNNSGSRNTLHIRTSSRSVGPNNKGDHKGGSGNNSPNASPRAGSPRPVSATAGAAAAAVVRPLLAPTPTAIHVDLPSPFNATASTPPPSTGPLTIIRPSSSDSNRVLVMATPSPRQSNPSINNFVTNPTAATSTTTSGIASGAGAAYVVRLHGIPSAASSSIQQPGLTHTMSSATTLPLSPTAINAAMATALNGVAAPIIAATTSPTASSITDLQHCYANEKQEVLR